MPPEPPSMLCTEHHQLKSHKILDYCKYSQNMLTNMSHQQSSSLKKEKYINDLYILLHVIHMYAVKNDGKV